MEEEVVDPPRTLAERLEAERAHVVWLAGVAIVGVTTLVLLFALQPRLILSDNTPTGGDMGAHVWGPAFLRDHLLPSLSGWSMDWYAGLPAYRFYMVLPALATVILDVVLPYGIAMKIVAVAGILTLPLATLVFGRLAGFRHPLPELMVLGSFVFLFDESFTIYGGNIASTMAGEFSFSIALSLSMLAFGAFVRALDTGRGVGWTSVAVALSALSHGIVLMFVFGGVVLLALVFSSRRSLTTGFRVVLFGTLLSAFWVVPFLANHAFMTDMKYEPRPSGGSDSFWSMYFPLAAPLDVAITALAIVGFAGFVVTRQRVGVWLGVYAIVLAFGVWVARASLPVIGLLWNPRVLPFMYLLRYLLAFAGVYFVAVFVARSIRIARAVSAARASDDGTVTVDVVADRGGLPRDLGLLVVAAAVTLAAVGFRFQELPFGSYRANAAGETVYAWGPFTTKAGNDGFVDGWARWNFSGYEGKAAYGEHYELLRTMQRIGEDPNHGCGRALWEVNSEINRYGTTMALMLLPFWTDGCIASMEGLYFEASGTTPYHFIAAAAMSQRSSNPVRELRYVDNDARVGVDHLLALGVRYYMAFTPAAVAEAAREPRLREIARSGPWVVYAVQGASIVEPLDRRPVVVTPRSGDPRERWLEIGTSVFQQPDEWSAPVVADGPAEWQRISVDVDESRRQGAPGESGRRVDVVVPVDDIVPVDLDPVVVSDVVIEQQSVSFRVDRVGVPVLVRVSYFPNWRADGAAGPWRVAPNMMVVVPESERVTLRFTASMRDRFAQALTLVGIVGLAIGRRRVARRHR